MIKYLLLKPLEPDDLPTLRELTTNEICKVWASASKYIRKELSQKRAVEIGVGTFALVPAQASVGEGQVLAIERPVFQPCRFLKKFYKLKCAKTKIPDETPFIQLDFEEIATAIHFRSEIVERCIHETLLFFAGAIRDKKEVEFSFRGIGILAVRRRTISMTFFDDCLLELDTTGNMLAALIGDPKIMRLVAFAGKNNFNRFSRDEVITLPRFAREIPHQTSATVISLKPRRDSTPWGRGARRGDVSAECWQGSGTSTDRAEKRLQLLMAWKRQEVEAEVWLKYHASRAGQKMEQGQSLCRYVYEDPYCPPHLLRKAYAEKLKERFQKNERCPSPTRQRTPEGQAELPPLQTAWEVKGEKKRLFDRRGKAQELSAKPTSCEQPPGVPGQEPEPSWQPPLPAGELSATNGQGKELVCKGEGAK
ncbi:hypothetical protein AV530_008525 [Patagioenas fasciata monilis]|uniref:Coiled-coil domain-containing protein 81 n=1 Tax=Patagioenas fasciata monilis TaxID=372326 RepID=A0A1V4KCS1_PATFA|nr:hypothetical protein AV530_008525 [Patagioenas fasciata monilis]